MNTNFERNKKIVEKNMHKDNMLGDLCRDISHDMNFPWLGDSYMVFHYLDSLIKEHGNYLKEPVRRFKISIKKIKVNNKERKKMRVGSP